MLNDNPAQKAIEYQTKEGKEGNYLFNDTLNTFYLRLYTIGRIR